MCLVRNLKHKRSASNSVIHQNALTRLIRRNTTIFYRLIVGLKVCSRRQQGSSYRIVNGTYAVIDDYPFLVSVQRWSKNEGSHICGGTFVSDQWILTAGHCVDDPEFRQGGIVRVESSFHASGGIFLPIERTVLHDSFDYGSPGIDYDYGLIKLVARFERAVPVRLVAPYRRFPPGELCTVVGWGMTKKTGDREQLRMVRLPIVRQEVCKEIYEGWETITRRMICAGYAAGGQDACEGDSGGPLLCRGIQAGITSWGVGCAKANRYGFYANVANQRDWIRKHAGVKISPTTVMVRANSSFFNRGGKLHRVEKVIKHERFSYATGDYDFGLLKLKQRYRRGTFVKLPERRRRFPPAERCTAMGWGETLGRESREQLREVVMPIVSQAVCRKAYEGTDEITARMLCAGYPEGMRDACDGDSGGPLICRGIQAGVISWAIGCAQPNKYGVYSSIAEGREWIRNHTGV
uniref:trypsin n=1 Tax=Anopheles arabiensis TaxID=7173 RepID=A0A182I5R2_ANOAR